EAGGRRTRDVQIIVETECQMIRRNTGLESREHENLFCRADLENASCAVPHIQIALMIKSDAAGDSHSLGKQLRMARATYSLVVAFVSARDKQLAGQTESQPRCVHDIGHKTRNRPPP